MIAPAPEYRPLGTLDDFIDESAAQAWFVDCGFVTKQVAVDNLQWLAERWLLVDEHGQDEVQAIMASAFTPPPEPCEMPDHYPARLVRQWEMQDPQTRWLHTGEAPPPPVKTDAWLQQRPYRTAQSTIDAFHCVVREGNPTRLTRWLAEHSLDSELLLKISERSNAVA